MKNAPKIVDTINLGNSAPEIRLGQWYWVTEKCRWDNDNYQGSKEGDSYTRLGCVMKIGSNYVELHTPHSKTNGFAYVRVHLDDFWTMLKFEPEANTVIQNKIAHWQQKTNGLLDEVRNVAARLGLRDIAMIDSQLEAKPESMELMTLSGAPDIEGYKLSLLKAKEETLPELFEAIKKSTSELSRWLLATTMETQALMIPMQGSIGEINDRIFNIGIYAGLAESAVLCSDGATATMADKLHVMQRRLYMDEECLLNYDAGGMEFKDIFEFDAWVSKPENRDRILPFPRTLVAMRIRRKEKERDHEGSMLQAHINVRLAAADKFTYLYIRNGEQVWRIICEMEFGEMIFPDESIFSPDEPKMMKMFGNSVDKMITVALFEELMKEFQLKSVAGAAWVKENPGKSWIENPHYSTLGGDVYIKGFGSFRPHEWKPFDKSNVHFDDGMAKIEKQIKEYNRIALIIQGLFDRSLVLHPHRPVKSWEHASFEAAVTLVFDGKNTIYAGETPDFEAYRMACNSTLAAGSVVTGQQLFWMHKEAEKENARRARDYRNRDQYTELKTYQPPGNPGPGKVTKIVVWGPRKRTAEFFWFRERSWYSEGPDIRTSVVVPESELFNISAYKVGDYKQFFADPRTRENYLKWAPLLLTAEDYLAGKIRVKEVV